MYSFCKKNGLVNCWRYLWSEWYRPGNWEMWALSAKEDFISVLRSTMIIEGHWSDVKGHELVHFNAPRLDFVGHSLITSVLPRALEKLIFLKSKNRAQYNPPWRKNFKKTWIELSKRKIPSSTAASPNPTKMTCTCPSILLNRFRLCKHLVQSFRMPPDSFFNHVQRHTTIPIWTGRPNDLLPAVMTIDSVEEDELGGLTLKEEEAEPHQSSKFERFISAPETARNQLQRSIDVLDELRGYLASQLALGNQKFANSVEKAFAGNRKMLEELRAVESKKKADKTWRKRRAPASMYFQRNDESAKFRSTFRPLASSSYSLPNTTKKKL
ncbi:hypothetical protein BT69DRAFT_1381236 [Atractiella rhizophila]|nr:hypothetical protein BT69DRAFT_1381236 [Atractiella rhizophila]